MEFDHEPRFFLPLLRNSRRNCLERNEIKTHRLGSFFQTSQFPLLELMFIFLHPNPDVILAMLDKAVNDSSQFVRRGGDRFRRAFIRL